MASSPPPLPMYFVRHDDVDAVGLAVDVLVDPVQLDLELLGREGERAEHAEAAGLAHRGDDVAAVAEGEDRELDAELVADRCTHGRPLRSDGYGGRRPRRRWKILSGGGRQPAIVEP